MANKAYNYNFRMYMEGIHVPFKSAMITCTPNGVEANINLLSNKEVYQLKPKTAVQIFYKDWVDVTTKNDKSGAGLGWRLMFDGFLSGYFKVDESLEGRGLGIICRDFRMDIRRSPAALAWQEAFSLGNQEMYHLYGAYQTIVDRGNQKSLGREKKGSNVKETALRTYDSSGLNDLGETFRRIARTAYGKNTGTKRKQKDNEGGTENKIQKNGDFAYKEFIAEVKDQRSRTQGAFFLDAVVRGMWSEAVGGTSVGTFINRRARVDKRFMIPRNAAGYDFWFRNQGGLEIGSTIMGNSMFTSLEAAIMRLAGLFSVRVYSCSTPSLINLGIDESGWVMEDRVKNYMVEDQKEFFGAPYILNETMLLPPMEFTAPPNCNIILPPMYDRIQWQYDIDADVTRAYFKQIDSLSTPSEDSGLMSQNVQIPTALFNNLKNTGNQKGIYERIKPPITLEERYKGVNVHQGSVEHTLAGDDISKAWHNTFFTTEAVKRIENKIAELKNLKNKADKKNSQNIDGLNLTTLQKRLKEARQKVTEERVLIRKEQADSKKRATTKNAMDRHALIKFLNSKYSGRVATVDMQFNPYLMCGFPGAVIASDEQYGGESMKTVIGTVQVVKHSIAISPSGGDARTSITLNNARYVDESTDIDQDGNPLYSKATNPRDAQIDDDLSYSNPVYYVQEPKSSVVKNLNNDYYDLDVIADPNDEGNEYKYAKDFLTLTKKQKGSGQRNRIYLDDEYAPNRVAKFYSEVFNHRERSFMIGTSSITNDAGQTETINFMYDTIHEAIDALKRTRKDLLNSYENCIKFVARDVCSADAYFQGIVGASIKTRLNENGQVDDEASYKTFTKNFDHTRIEERYYGVTTELWNSGKIDGLKKTTESGGKAKKTNGLMGKPGEFSSIREHMPITAFIQERRKAVENYVKEVNERVQGIQYANDDRRR